jgi:deoxyribodipyrimidine photo-lyase
VRQLYASGYLHNHARMWLASYCVHLRKVHWRAGADWLVGHLLDGDLASNHLSWQWVAATFSSKPYLFNAGNIVKYAPPADWKTWHSPRTVVDTSYEALDYIARHDPDIGAEKGQHMAVTEPVMLTAALGSFIEHFFKKNSANVAVTSSYIAINYVANLASSESIELVHPWALGQRKPQHDAARADVWRVGIIDLAAHQAQPWGALRWRWVLARMADIVDSVWVGDLAQLRAQQLAYAVGSMQSTTLTNTLPIHSSATLYARYRDWLPQMGAVRPKAHFFAAPAKTCSSFSQFYEGTKKIQPNFSSLLTA